jgi:hypothetical protein
MKMLCVKGAVAKPGWHDGLKAGGQYDVEYWNCACGLQPRATAAESTFHRWPTLVCSACGAQNQMAYVPWGRDRFIPFDPEQLKITEQEVRELYAPDKEKVKA